MTKLSSNNINDLLKFPDFEVIFVEETEKFIILEGECPKETICPHCKNFSTKRHRGRTKKIRHLNCFSKPCFLQFPHFSYHCEHCHLYFLQELSFLNYSTHHTNQFIQEILALAKGCSLKHVSQLLQEPYTTIERLYYSYLLQQNTTKTSFDSKHIGIDEIALKKGQNSYILLIYDLDEGKLLEVLENRKKATLKAFLENLEKSCKQSIEVVCIDMWKPYRETVKEVLPKSKLVIDRFHVSKELSKAVDKVRKELHEEGKFEELSADERKKLFWATRYSEATLKKKRKYKKVLEKAMEISVELKKAIELKWEFRKIFEMKRGCLAVKRLKKWRKEVGHSKLKPLKKFVKTFENWKEWIINFFPYRYSNGPAEGLNNKVKLIKRLGFGFDSFKNFRLRLLHTCGYLT